MTIDHLTYALLGALAIALLFCMYSDIRHRLIYNKVTFSIALAAPLYWFATGQYDLATIGIHLLTGVLVFAFFAVMFNFGLMLGGDVKLFAALGFWFHWVEVIKLMLIASLVGGVVTIVFFVIHKLRKQKDRAMIPYGVAISISGLWTVVNQILTI
jgi:prepilin peptidase CpaA